VHDIPGATPYPEGIVRAHDCALNRCARKHKFYLIKNFRIVNCHLYILAIIKARSLLDRCKKVPLQRKKL
jgi:hypothetical protein